MTTENDPFREAVSKEFTEAGYADKEIQTVLAQQDALRHGEDKNPRLDPHHKPTWIKVHTKHVLPSTLDAFHLPWEYDELDEDYVLIKKWISMELQEDLFEHTRQVREGHLRVSSRAGGKHTYAEAKRYGRNTRVYGNEKLAGYSGARKRCATGKEWIYT
ncbi:uncharacterized protein BDV17DRAFT_288335 [Aspergillus undulatus]|uniref:uncharacterized protein n=1 Tax=Aspergillus undulatus TaxID=1810928 RepID=UPI003CCD4E57